MRNQALDILKYFSAIMVVFIHITFTGSLGTSVMAVARFAVPVFFMTSGYFSYKAIVEADAGKLLKRAWAITKIFIAAVIIFAACEVVINGSRELISTLLSAKTWIMLLVFNNFNYGFFIPLWFLPSLIYIYIYGGNAAI